MNKVLQDLKDALEKELKSLILDREIICITSTPFVIVEEGTTLKLGHDEENQRLCFAMTRNIRTYSYSRESAKKYVAYWNKHQPDMKVEMIGNVQFRERRIAEIENMLAGFNKSKEQVSA